MITDKIDVCINVFGKPFQTISTLKSLLKFSKEKIDKIYLIGETIQPDEIEFEEIIRSVNYDKIEFYQPKTHLWINKTDINKFSNDKEYRLSNRYQYGIENTNKKFLMIIHNDIIFQNDVVSEMLNKIGDSAGIGEIGQCWNCPLFYEKICSGEKFNDNLEKKISFNEVMGYVVNHTNLRTFYQSKNQIRKENPIPLPECRLNEWCCLINMEIYKKEVLPLGSVYPIGGIFTLDTGTDWFQQMVLKGYKFVNFNLDGFAKHGFFSEKGCGHPSLFDKNQYILEEEKAKKYIEENL